MPLAQADLFGQEAREVQPDDLNISDQPIVEFESPPKFYLTLDELSKHIEICRLEDTYFRELTKLYKLLGEQRRQCRLDFLRDLIADENNSGLEDIVRFLQDHGAATNSWDESIGLPRKLYAPLSPDYEDKVRLIIDQGAHANNCYDLSSALRFAVNRGNEGMVRLLLDNGANANNRYDESSLLEVAVNCGYEGIVQLLLDIGADVKATALSIIGQKGYQSMVRFYQSPVLQEALAA